VWDLNRRADEAATAGVQGHTDDAALAETHSRKVLEIADIQTHIQHRLREYADRHPTEYGPPGQRVHRAGRAKRTAHRTDPLQALRERRQIQAEGRIEWCQKCGRRTRLGGAQARANERLARTV